MSVNKLRPCKKVHAGKLVTTLKIKHFTVYSSNTSYDLPISCTILWRVAVKQVYKTTIMQGYINNDVGIIIRMRHPN